MEAHGGYTFCGVAALVILKKEHLLNLRSLLVSGTTRAAPQLSWCLPASGRGCLSPMVLGGRSLSSHWHPLLSVPHSTG